MFQRVITMLLVALAISSCWNFSLPEPHSLKYQEKEFNALANLIISQDQIYEMDDFTRYYKSINNVPVKLTTTGENQAAQLLNVVVDSLKLDAKIVSTLKVKLEETKLREFVKSGDTILFTVDGFLNDAWGFMYCKRGLETDSTYFQFKGHSVKFVENMNLNWKKTAIN